MDILIVDDSVTTRRVIRRTLVSAGIDDLQIAEAGDGCAALEVLEAQRTPALVLCDVNMPRMSGEILLEKAAALAEPHVFVMVTSVATARKKLELMRLGARTIVPKPFDPAVLADLLAPYLRRDTQPAGQPDPEPSQTPLPEDAALATLGLAALQSVLEQMAFTEVMVSDAEPPRAVLFGASVRLDAGEKRWIVRLATGSDAAGDLAGRIIGQGQAPPPGDDPAGDDALRLDAMRELVNMVGGDLVTRTVARFEGTTLSLPTSSVLPPGAVRPGSMRGLRLVPGGHYVWLGLERLP
jgi:CheY-like chemotaxis protein